MVPAGAAQAASPTIAVVSTRADLVSGGDALVRIGLPAGARGMRVRAGARDVTAAFTRRSRGRAEGLVDGLAVGRTRLTVRLRDGRGAALTVTNHPSGGPLIAGPQVTPWICQTERFGLGPAADAQCTVKPQTRYVYRSSNPLQIAFRRYDPAHPADDVATTTTDDGRRVPFVVRLETGTMDRGVYNVAVLEQAWNHKLLWPFGGDCKPFHKQDLPVDALGGLLTPQATLDPALLEPIVQVGLDEALGGVFGNANAVTALGRGFMVASNSLNKYGSSCNSVTSAEAVLMLKEHIAERYGSIRYTIGAGSSGGSMQQHQIASAYPGLLDAIQPMASFPDVWELFQEAQDCHLLNRYFNASPLWLLPTQRYAVFGTAPELGCLLQHDGPSLGTPDFGSYSAAMLDPSNAVGCGLPAAQVYHAQRNPKGVRCTLADYMVSVFGRRAGDGFANQPFDNVGVQYGLRALQSGAISPEQFVDLNEKVGGLTIDWQRRAQRSVADPGALRAAYRGGLVTSGRELARVPIVDIRGTDNVEIHSDFHSHVARARLDRDGGGHPGQVMFMGLRALLGDPTSVNVAFDVVDEWLTRLEHDRGGGSRAQQLRRTRPARAADSCWLEGRQITDLATCRTLFPYFADARIAAGGPQTDDVLKCALRSLRRGDYAVRFSDGQWARLQRAFPRGVCDYDERGVGQRPPLRWPTFAGGPGGHALGPAPRSRALPRRAPVRPRARTAAVRGAATPRLPGPEHAFAVTRQGDPELPDHTILRPADLDAPGFKLPLVLWANGGCRQSNEEFRYFLTRLASYGVFVVANGAPANPYRPEQLGGIVTPDPQLLIDAMDWALASRFRDHIDTSRIVVMGQSCGGWEAVDASRDERVRTTIVWNNGAGPLAGNVANLHAPTLFVSGGVGDYTLALTLTGYARATVPAVYADHSGGGHTGLWDDNPDGTHTPLQDEPPLLAAHWLRFMLYGRPASRAFFLGDRCGLCTRPRWTVRSKNWAGYDVRPSDAPALRVPARARSCRPRALRTRGRWLCQLVTRTRAPSRAPR
jgi:dienelactone hydrolase